MVRSELLADEARTVFQPSERVLQLTVTYRGSSDYKRAVRHGFGHALVFLCVRQQRRRTDSGARLTKSSFIWGYHSQVTETEVAHGASGRANVKRIARSHQDDAQTVEFSRNRQEC